MISWEQKQAEEETADFLNEDNAKVVDFWDLILCYAVFCVAILVAYTMWEVFTK